MSLFQFGFQRTSCSSSGSFDPGQHAFVPDHMPAIEESGLGIVEYQSALSTVSDVANPTPTKKRRLRGTYIQYSPKDRAKIGQYGLEHGNESVVSLATNKTKTVFINRAHSKIMFILVIQFARATRALPSEGNHRDGQGLLVADGHLDLSA